ncbi:unnamed protein product [Hymenolepis diminuta]|uniref:Uncharacterized protein n=1 Tax=Hymenolepis diminuta TaxID=6216 RepID=A0A564Z0S4_HYMDI|nr:unnamed protein product [Hymenolepis diminuta]
MDKIRISKILSNQINEILTSEATDKERIFNEFLKSSGFDSTHHRISINKKVDILAQSMQKLRHYDKKSQNLRQSSVSFKNGASSATNQSNLLKNLNTDFDTLFSRLQTISDSLKRISKLPQLLDEVKGVEIEVLCDAAKNFESEIETTSPRKSSALPDYFNLSLMENLRFDVSQLQIQVNKLQEDIKQFGDIGTVRSSIYSRPLFLSLRI